MKKLAIVAAIIAATTVNAEARSGIITTADWMRLENNPYNYGPEETSKKLGEFGDALNSANEAIGEVLKKVADQIKDI